MYLGVTFLGSRYIVFLPIVYNCNRKKGESKVTLNCGPIFQSLLRKDKKKDCQENGRELTSRDKTRTRIFHMRIAGQEATFVDKF